MHENSKLSHGQLDTRNDATASETHTMNVPLSSTTWHLAVPPHLSTYEEVLGTWVQLVTVGTLKLVWPQGGTNQDILTNTT